MKTDDPAIAPEMADARPLAFARVFVVANQLDRLADEALSPLGLTAKQWLLLAVVEQAFPGRRPTLSEAATAYGTSRQNVKAIARGLETAGYLRLVPDPADGRATRLVVTERTAVFATPEWRAREAAFFGAAFGDLPPAEAMTLADLLGRWLAVLLPNTHSSDERIPR